MFAAKPRSKEKLSPAPWIPSIDPGAPIGIENGVVHDYIGTKNDWLLPGLKGAGVRSIRLEIKKINDLGSSLSHYESICRNVQEAGIDGISLIIDYNTRPGEQSRWNEASTSPTNPFIDDLNRDTQEILARIGKYVSKIEIWNEPNGSLYKLNPDVFAKLQHTLYTTIKTYNQNIRVISGGIEGIFSTDASYLWNANTAHQKLFGVPIWKSCDAVGYHYYKRQYDKVISSTIAYDFRVFRNNSGIPADVSLDVSEFGWQTTRVTAQTQADNSKAMFLMPEAFPDVRVTAINQYRINDTAEEKFGIKDPAMLIFKQYAGRVVAIPENQPTLTPTPGSLTNTPGSPSAKPYQK